MQTVKSIRFYGLCNSNYHDSHNQVSLCKTGSKGLVFSKLSGSCFFAINMRRRLDNIQSGSFLEKHLSLERFTILLGFIGVIAVMPRPDCPVMSSLAVLLSHLNRFRLESS